MALTMADLYCELGEARRELLVLRPLAAEAEQLRATVARLEAELAQLRASVTLGHDFQREESSRIQRCSGCGMRTTEPLQVMTTCAEYRELLAHKRTWRTRKQTVEVG